MAGAASSGLGVHGASELPAVLVDSYNLELRDKDGFIGDRASKGAFTDILDQWRDRLRKLDEDPLGDKPSEEIRKKELDEILLKGAPEAAGIIHGALEDFAQEFAAVIRKFLRAKGWQDTERIVVGGGFRGSRACEVAIGRAMMLLKGTGVAIDLVPIRHHSDEAGVIGAAYLVPTWMLSGHDAMLAVDIGGTNIRTGLLGLDRKDQSNLAEVKVLKSSLWRHADDGPNREAAVARLVDMLENLLSWADKEKLKPVPLIGVGCPGIIEADGSISRGGQNLPGGNWESGKFNLAAALAAAIPTIAGHETMIVMHNDAVVQGLSEVPFMRDVERWGIATIGTGLGNARFTNRAQSKKRKR